MYLLARLHTATISPIFPSRQVLQMQNATDDRKHFTPTRFSLLCESKLLQVLVQFFSSAADMFLLSSRLSFTSCQLFNQYLQLFKWGPHAEVLQPPGEVFGEEDRPSVAENATAHNENLQVPQRLKSFPLNA